MQQQVFTDGIGKITVIGGVVRLDFMVYSPTDADAQGQPRQIFTHQVLMAVDAFVRASAQCIEAVKQIQAASQPVAAAPPAPKPVAPPAPKPVAPPAPMPTSVAAPAPAAPPRKAEPSPWTANLKPIPFP